jgi:phosphotriesterase-related protein
MTSDSDTGSIVTVTGRIDPEDLGVALPHEHLFADWSARFTPPDSATERRLAREPISLENLGFVHRNKGSHEDNLRLDSLEEAVEEVTTYRNAGGEAIVDVTPKNVGNDPVRSRAVSLETGVHVVQGTAYYNVRNSDLPDRLASASIEEIADEFVHDVREGIDDTGVRAGIVGEIGLSDRIHDVEEKVLRAGARAAARTGAALTIHPPGATAYAQRDRTYPASRWGLDILDIVEEEGLAPDRVIIDHQDQTRWYENLDYQKELAERGAYVEYDLFNAKHTHFKEAHDDAYPSDVERVERLMELIEAGHGSRLLVSQDVYLKIHRVAYGGFGYAHILKNVVPIFRALGAEESQIRQLMVDNPRRVLTFQEPA